jgi:hypothetical protein
MISFPVIQAAVVAVTTLSGALAPQGRDECLPARDLAQKSFARLDGLGVKFAFVWVDDIRSKFVGGYDPFDVFVVTGRIYSPFEMATGKLERPAFERLSRPGRNIERFGPLSVPSSFPRGRPPALRFTSGGAAYELRVRAVQPARFGGEGVVTYQVCKAR